MKKKFLLFLVALVLALVLVSCSDDDDSSSTTGLDFTNDNWVDDIDYYIIYDYQAGEIVVQTDKDVETSGMNVNGHQIFLNEWEYDEDEDFAWFPWYTTAAQLTEYEDLSFTEGAELEFTLSINGNENSATVKVPTMPQVTFPEIDLTSDYVLEWTSIDDPEVQVVDFELDLFDELGDYDFEYVEVLEQLSGSVRDFTISSDNYSDYSDWTVEDYYISVDSANYSKSGKFMVLIVNSDVNSTYDWDKCERRNKYQSILKQISSK